MGAVRLTAKISLYMNNLRSGLRYDAFFLPSLFVVDILSFASLVLMDWHWFTKCASIAILAVFTLVFLWNFFHTIVLWFTTDNQILKLVTLLVSAKEHASLNYVLRSIDLPTLVQVSPRSFEILCDFVLSERMGVETKAVLIDALQKQELGLALREGHQDATAKIILSCYDEDLTILKTLIDGCCTYLNFYKLVYTDLRHSKRQVEVVGHVKAQGLASRKKLGRSHGVKVLSDIDDTNKASGGKPGGVDKRFPKHAYYPGVFELYKALDGRWRPDEASSNLVLLSARPHVYKAESEEHALSPLVPLLEAGSLHSFPTLLPGRFRSSVPAGLFVFCAGSAAWRGVGEEKFLTYTKYRELYQEYDFAFLGDDGQGDLMAGQQMIQHDEECRNSDGPRLVVVLIHKVNPPKDRVQVVFEEMSRELGPEWEASWRNRGLLMFESHVGAAVALHEYDPNLMHLDTLESLTTVAIEEFDLLRAVHVNWDVERWSKAEEVICRDVERVNAILRNVGRELLGMPSSHQNCIDHTASPRDRKSEEATREPSERDGLLQTTTGTLP